VYGIVTEPSEFGDMIPSAVALLCGVTRRHSFVRALPHLHRPALRATEKEIRIPIMLDSVSMVLILPQNRTDGESARTRMYRAIPIKVRAAQSLSKNPKRVRTPPSVSKE
jgi:hypothetical protein